MPHIVSTLEFAARAKDRTWQMMTRVYEQAARVVNGQIGMGDGWNPVVVVPLGQPNAGQPILNMTKPANKDNQKGAIVYCTFAAANTDTIISHNLGYIPRCYIPLWKAISCDVYDGNGQSTNPAFPTPNYQPPGLGLSLVTTMTRPDGTSPFTTVTTSTIPLRCTVATNVLLLIF
jgi:hypothetical protein